MATQQQGGTPCQGTPIASGGTTTAAASPLGGAPSEDAKRGAYRNLANNLDELVERDHEGSGGSASLLAKGPWKTNLGSNGDRS